MESKNTVKWHLAFTFWSTLCDTTEIIISNLQIFCGERNVPRNCSFEGSPTVNSKPEWMWFQFVTAAKMRAPCEGKAKRWWEQHQRLLQSVRQCDREILLALMRRVFHLSYKLRCCKKIFVLEKSHNNAREKIRWFFRLCLISPISCWHVSQLSRK